MIAAIRDFLRLSAVGLCVGIAGLALLFHGLRGTAFVTRLWGNDLDPNLICWTVEYGFQKIFVQLQPLGLWNANIYYPHLNSLAYLDSMLSAQLLYAPLRLMGVSMLPALYLTLIGFTLAGAVLTDRLLQRYDFTAGERALIVVAAHFSLPMSSFLVAHYQLFGMHLAPAILLLAHRLLNRWQGNDLAFVTLLFCLAGGFATYVVPMVGLLGILLLLVFAVPILRHVSLGEIGRSLGWKGPAVALLVLLIFFVVQLRPYLSLFGSLPPQPMSETYVYSARPWSILLHASQNSYWYDLGRVQYGHWERAAFPGIPLLCLAVLGAITIVWRTVAVRPKPAASEVVSLETYAVVVFLLCWMLSLGPYVHVPGTGFQLSLPFLLVAKLIPGVDNIRAPGRYAQLYGLPLGLMAVFCLRWFFARWANMQVRLAPTTAAWAVAVVILFDQMPRIATYPFAVEHAAFYRAAQAHIARGEPIIELPIAGNDHLDTWARRTRQLVSSTVHWGWLITGTGSRDTPEQNELIGLDTRLRRGAASLADIESFARRLGVKKIAVFPAEYPSEVRDQIREQARGSAGVIFSNSEGYVLTVPR